MSQLSTPSKSAFNELQSPWDSISLPSFELEIRNYLLALREKIIESFESLEPIHRLIKTPWNHPTELGGGEMGVIRGDHFEKAAVNFSCIAGENFPMADGKGPYSAMGVSLITHMKNPKAPTVHFNLRRITTKEKSWFAGGYDLSPMGFVFEEDTLHFHKIAKKSLLETDRYEEFSRLAQEYFYIPHRNKQRGVGGIFFDHYNRGDASVDFELFRSIGDHFLEAIMPIYRRRIHEPYDAKDRDIQRIYRSHYVEFNLIYDRGTKFGFASGGNPEAILCSLPPSAGW